MSAVKLNRGNFGELLTPIHRKVFFDSYKEKDKQYPQIFKTETSSRKEESFPHFGAFGKWGENTEGSDFNFDDIDQGDVATFVARRFDKSYEITWELMQDDQYNVMKGSGRGGSAQKLARGLRATEESDAASVVVNGFNNVGYDGVALFSDIHPLINSSGTCSNQIDGVLSDANLKAALTKMRLQVDEAGVLIAAHANRLVVHPDWEFTARALIGSTLQAGVDLNDKNTLPSLNITVWDYLAEAENAKPWFVQDSSMDNLLFLWRENPIFDSEKISNKMDYRFYGYCRFDTGYVDWRGLVGSAGTSGDSSPGVGTLTVTSQAGATSGKSAIAVAETAAEGNSLVYKTHATTAPAVIYDQDLSSWTALPANGEITATNGHKITVAEVNSIKRARQAGSATITSNVG